MPLSVVSPPGCVEINPSTRYMGRIKQDGLVVASVDAPSLPRMLTVLAHYATVMAEDGPMKIEVRNDKKRWRKVKL